MQLIVTQGKKAKRRLEASGKTMHAPAIRGMASKVRMAMGGEQTSAKAQRRVNSLAVFCGSGKGTRQEYLDAARELGNELARRDIRLVYGGGSIGLMGEVARTCKQAGGSVYGCMPEALAVEEVCGGVGEQDERFEVDIVDGMSDRKCKMEQAADAFICLPGGFGALSKSKGFKKGKIGR